MDARTGYHQVLVRKCDCEKLAFFTPEDEKLCFRVMPFGPFNAPGFYSCMMGNFKKEWDGLFLEIMREHALSGVKVDNKIVKMKSGNIHLDDD